MRRDYLMETIETFIQNLMKIAKLMTEGRSSEAKTLLNQEAEKCVGLPLDEVASMSDDQLLSRLLQAESAMGVRERCYMCVSVLTEAGKLALQGGRAIEGRSLLLKALQLSLSTLSWNHLDQAPAFVPTIQNLTTLLSGEPIPAYVRGALMRHFERIGAYADAESHLFALADDNPGDASLAELGKSFYQRLTGLSDEALAAGDLPREEVATGLQDFHRKMSCEPGCDQIRVRAHKHLPAFPTPSGPETP